MKGRGFTLIELLVALAVFAVLAVMAYGGLNQVLMTRSAVDDQAEALRSLQRCYLVLARDIEGVVPRPVRDELGSERPALASGGGAAGALLELTRGGWRNPAGQPRSSLQRVAWRLDEERLVRYQWLVLDRVQDSQPLEQPVIEGVEQAEFRFLDREGQWQGQWPPPNVQGDAGLPRAVEVNLELERWGEIRWLFRLP